MGCLMGEIRPPNYGARSFGCAKNLRSFAARNIEMTKHLCKNLKKKFS